MWLGLGVGVCGWIGIFVLEVVGWGWFIEEEYVIIWGNYGFVNE